MQLSLIIGPPEPLSSTTDSVAQSCNSNLNDQNMALNQVVIYPVDFSETLLSSVATNVDLAISEYFVNSAGNLNFNAGVNSLNPGYSFAGIVGGQSADGSETRGTYIAMDPTYAIASGCKE